MVVLHTTDVIRSAFRYFQLLIDESNVRAGSSASGAAVCLVRLFLGWAAIAYDARTRYAPYLDYGIESSMLTVQL